MLCSSSDLGASSSSSEVSSSLLAEWLMGALEWASSLEARSESVMIHDSQFRGKSHGLSASESGVMVSADDFRHSEHV